MQKEHFKPRALSVAQQCIFNASNPNLMLHNIAQTVREFHITPHETHATTTPTFQGDAYHQHNQEGDMGVIQSSAPFYFSTPKGYSSVSM